MNRLGHAILEMRIFYQKIKRGALAFLCLSLVVPSWGCSTLEKTYQSTRELLSATEKSVKVRLTPSLEDLEFARNQFKLNKYEVAEYYLKKTIMEYPANATAVELLPWTYFYGKRYDKALVAFQRAHSFSRKSVDPLVGMAWTYFALKQYELAVETFDRAEALAGPNSWHIRKGKGFCHLALGLITKARSEFQKIYNPRQTDEVFEIWQRWHIDDLDPRVNLVSFRPNEVSLFALPVEHPRYPGTLMGLAPLEPKEDLEKAWEYYRTGSFTKALKLFESMDLNLEHSPDATNGLAWSYLQNRQVRKAEELFEKILRSYPTFPGARTGMREVMDFKKKQAEYANYYYEMGKDAIAQDEFQKLTREFPRWPHPQVQLARLDLKRDAFDAARSKFQKALDLEPDNEAAVNGLEQIRKVREAALYEADLHLKKADYKTATQVYLDYIEERGAGASLDRPLASAYKGLGWTLYHKHQYGLAAAKFLRAMEFDEYRLESARGVGLSYFNLEDYKTAAQYLKIFYAAHPENQEVAYKLDRSIQKSWPAREAMEYFERNLKDYPLRASIYMGMGWIHYGLKNPDLAVEYFVKSISLDPEFAMTLDFQDLLRQERFGWQVYNRFGWAYYHLGRHDRSIEMFNIALERQPNKSNARLGLAYNYYRLGDYKEATRYLQQVLALNPEPVPIVEKIAGTSAIAPFEMETTARTKLGRAYLLQGNYPEAIALFTQELERTLDQADAQDGLAWAYLKLNRLTEARTAFMKSIRLEPLNNLSHKGLALVKQLIAAQKIRKRGALPLAQTALPDLPSSRPTATPR